MISLVSTRPALLIGHHHQVICYETDWIAEALRRAATAAGRDDFPFIDDICKGIVYYLENKCPLSMLPIQDLYIRINHMLTKIGCEAVAEQLTVLSPPVTISLASTVRDCDFAFELGFFHNLQVQLDQLRSFGVEKIEVLDLRETVMLLKSTRRWTKTCDLLAHDIIAYVENVSKAQLEVQAA